MRNTRGSTSSLCRRAVADPSLERYPRLPVLACHGHDEAAAPTATSGATACHGHDEAAAPTATSGATVVRDG